MKVYKLFIILSLFLISSCDVHEIDCSGIIYGNNQIDQCGVCNNPDTTNFNSSCKDCFGVINGEAEYDQCGICTGGESNISPCEEDCYGEFGGGAYIDDCGICVGYTYYTNTIEVIRPPSVDSDNYGQGDGECDGTSSDNDIICDFEPDGQCDGVDSCPDYDGDSLCDWEDDCIWGDTDLDTICNDLDDDDDGDGILDIIDGCSSPTGDPCDCYDIPENSVSLLESPDDGVICYHINYNLTTFNLTVEGTTINSAEGGAAAEAGFTVQGLGLTVIGFANDDAIPSGSNGTLTILNLNSDATGLSNPIFADDNSPSNPINMNIVDAEDYLTVNNNNCNCTALPTNSISILDNGMVLYDFDTAIAGFQFDIEGTTASAATGGDAAAAGFTVSAGGSTVLGYSFGGSINPGCGILTNLTLDSNVSNVTNLVFSDPAENQIPSTYFSCE